MTFAWQWILLVASPFVGSFLGVLIDRLPEDRTVVLGRSACASCGSALRPLDLLPLISWAALQGRCRRCGAPIGWFPPAIELAAVAVALWSVLVVPGWLAAPTAALGWTLLALAVIDWRHMILPDALTLPLLSGGLAVAAVLQLGVPVDQILGAAAGAAALGLVAAGYRRWTDREGLGLGDAKLFAAAGAWVGWQGLPSVLLIGSAAGLAITTVLSRALTAKGALPARHAIPFGPYLALGVWITWLYGPLGPSG